MTTKKVAATGLNQVVQKNAANLSLIMLVMTQLFLQSVWSVLPGIPPHNEKVHAYVVGVD